MTLDSVQALANIRSYGHEEEADAVLAAIDALQGQIVNLQELYDRATKYSASLAKDYAAAQERERVMRHTLWLARKYILDKRGILAEIDIALSTYGRQTGYIHFSEITDHEEFRLFGLTKGQILWLVTDYQNRTGKSHTEMPEYSGAYPVHERKEQEKAS